MNREILYIKGERNVEVKHPDVRLGDILSLECKNPAVKAKVKNLHLLKLPEADSPKGRRKVVSILKIMECIHQAVPDVDIENLGEVDMIVTFENQTTSSGWVHIVKTVFVSFIVFFGSAFSIMAFNNDVSTSKLFSQLYQQLTGQASSGFTILEVTYSIGLVIGILVFFNHFGKKRFSVDPTPMEIEMRLYENDIQTTLIENSSRKEQEMDVDQTNSSGHSRT